MIGSARLAASLRALPSARRSASLPFISECTGGHTERLHMPLNVTPWRSLKTNSTALKSPAGKARRANTAKQKRGELKNQTAVTAATNASDGRMVQTQNALEAAVQSLIDEPVLTVDAEFGAMNTYRTKLSLLQIGGAPNPLALTDNRRVYHRLPQLR